MPRETDSRGREVTERDSGERERTCGEVLGGQLGGLLRILRIREDQRGVLNCKPAELRGSVGISN